MFVFASSFPVLVDSCLLSFDVVELGFVAGGVYGSFFIARHYSSLLDIYGKTGFVSHIISSRFVLRFLIFKYHYSIVNFYIYYAGCLNVILASIYVQKKKNHFIDTF